MTKRVYEITSRINLMPLVSLEFESEQAAEDYVKQEGIREEEYYITWYNR